MTPGEYSFLCQFLKERSGLVLTEEKRYLLESRLGPVARDNNFANISELITAIQSPASEPLRHKVTEAMTINESFFYRDKTPFENFRTVMVPSLVGKRVNTKRLRIWSAAASTGQEAYTLAMEIDQMATKFAGWHVDILGTDLSEDAINRAKSGIYSQFEVQRGLPVQMLVKYFKQDGSEWQISSNLRSKVQFKQFNLLENFRPFGIFDIVFCRNVLIYFDRETKADILNRIADQTAPDGYLVLGAAETIVGITDAFETVPNVRGLYQRRAHDQPGFNATPAPLKAPAAGALNNQPALGTPRSQIAGTRLGTGTTGTTATTPTTTSGINGRPAQRAPLGSATGKGLGAAKATTTTTTTDNGLDRKPVQRAPLRPAVGTGLSTTTTAPKPATTGGLTSQSTVRTPQSPTATARLGAGSGSATSSTSASKISAKLTEKKKFNTVKPVKPVKPLRPTLSPLSTT